MKSIWELCSIFAYFLKNDLARTTRSQNIYTSILIHSQYFQAMHLHIPTRPKTGMRRYTQKGLYLKSKESPISPMLQYYKINSQKSLKKKDAYFRQG